MNSDLPDFPEIDTTRGSFWHSVYAALPGGEKFPLPRAILIYVLGVAITFLPLFITTLAGPDLDFIVPFSQDWNILFMFAISFPLLLTLTAMDQDLLTSALKQLIARGFIVIPKADLARLASDWETKFRAVNVWSQIVGIIVGIIVAVGNYYVVTQNAGLWQAYQGKLLIPGYIYLYCIFLFYMLVPVYVFRSVAFAFFVKAFIRRAEIHPLPLHPDRCGGLKPIGWLGLRNQYMLSVIGINVMLAFVVMSRFLEQSEWLQALIVAAAVSYFVLGPLVFMGPLLPFREGMLRAKQKFISEIEDVLRLEMGKLRQRISAGMIGKDDEDTVARLKKVSDFAAELPVWPFDVNTMRKFTTAYLLPLASGLLISLIKYATGLLFPGRVP